MSLSIKKILKKIIKKLKKVIDKLKILCYDNLLNEKIVLTTIYKD